jgi:hypothetical protein
LGCSLATHTPGSIGAPESAANPLIQNRRVALHPRQIGVGGGSLVFSIDNLDLDLENRGRSNFDLQHRALTSINYQIPFHSHSRFIDLVFGEAVEHHLYGQKWVSNDHSLRYGKSGTGIDHSR